MRTPRFVRLTAPALLIALPLVLPATLAATPASAQTGPGVGDIPQGTQSDASYAASFAAAKVTNVDATSGQVSCYRPEDPFFVSDGPNDGYTGMTACPGATTGENTGGAPYPTQAGSNPGFPAAGPMLAKDHSESDIRVDPTNPMHLIGSVKWFASAEGYNHVLGFFESFNGGRTWSTGHIPGYEGWTDNTDPVGAFDGFGNYYEFILPYQFFYNADGTHDFKIGTPLEPNPAEPAEGVAVAVRPHGAASATDWVTTHVGHPDFVATYDSVGNEPDKQWITIDDNPASSHYNRVYAMWVDFHKITPVPFVSFADARADGTHTDWSAPQPLPQPPHTPQGATYLLPHVAPDGTIYTTVTNFNPKQGFCCASVFVDKSTDGGQTWSVAGTAVPSVTPPPGIYPNTTFRDGIENTFAVGSHLDAQGSYPLYVAYEDFSAGVGNVMLTASYDGGATWSSPIQVNDNASPADEFQPNLTVAPDGTVSVNFYDRRLACPAAGTTQAAAAGLALDQVNPNYSGSLPPYGAVNYCVNASIQFYTAQLAPIGHNVRLSGNSFDPQLNSPHVDCATCETTFIGDYFGNTVAETAARAVDYSTFVSTYDDGTNPAHDQQQIVASVAVP
ncbi:MAG TPA: sialidase family protein [Streptosporangiaceae bacterium]|nr:sialidase family protein [Streptosporangiaceae bacterium]